VFHFHSYYFLPLVPAAALLASRGLQGLGLRRWRLVAVAALLVPGLVMSSLYLLASAKHTGTRNGGIAAVLRSQGVDPARTTLAVDGDYWNHFGPGLEHSARASGISDVVGAASAAGTPAEGTELVYVTPAGRAPAGTTALSYLPMRVTAPVLFGIAARSSSTSNQGFFTPSPPRFQRVGPWWRFGWEDREGWNGDMALYLAGEG
jgi:hypothetical protein